MERVIEINIHNKGNISIINLILGVSFLIIAIIKLTSVLGEELDTLDILSLIIFPLAGITYLLSGFGYNLSRLLKREKLVINDSSFFIDSLFNKTRINFEQIRSIELKKKSLIILLINAKKNKIHLLNWDKDKINELMNELNNKIRTSHNNGEHS